MKMLCLLLVSIGLLPTFARTVALWPLEADASGKVDGRCVIDPDNDLTANDKTNNSAVVAQDVGWNLPPNPDTAQGQSDDARRRVPNHSALPEVSGNDRRNQGSYALAADGSLTAPDVGHALMFTKPFTLEGWVNLSSEQTTTDGTVVYAGDPTSGTGLRIGFDCSGATPRLAVKAREDWPGTPIVEGTFDADLSAYVGQWTHFAVTYDPFDGTGTWVLYANGEKIGYPIANFYYPNARMIVRCGDFRLGGIAGAFDMRRIASGVLKPDEFPYATLDPLFIIV